MLPPVYMHYRDRHEARGETCRWRSRDSGEPHRRGTLAGKGIGGSTRAECHATGGVMYFQSRPERWPGHSALHSCTEIAVEAENLCSSVCNRRTCNTPAP